MFLTIKGWIARFDRSLSIQMKLLFVVMALLFGGGLMSVLTYQSMKRVLAAQGDYVRMSQVETEIKDLGLTLYKMALSTVNYIGDPTEDRWKQKESADQDLATAFIELKKRISNPELAKLINELSEYDENYFNPLDLTLKQARSTSSTDFVLKVYGMEYIPLLQKAEAAFKDAILVVQKDLEATRIATETKARQGIWIIMGVIVIGVIISTVLLRLAGTIIVNGLSRAIQNLKQETEATETAAKSISEASRQLAEATTQQAASLQQTAASVEQMTSMIHKSSENATESGKASETSAEVAGQGKEAAEQMLTSITEIERSNQEIMGAIEQSNKKLADIVRVISEIGNKTKIINDIVFQTKLLSFNASVEAARAGEHGKGFAVVAEEVGKLAQMSGTAAKEINQMLEMGVGKVESIITETRSTVEGLIVSNRGKVEAGAEVAKQSGAVLDAIVTEVQKVNTMVSEISKAMEEQSGGVAEINKAMGQLDTVTQQNAQLSQKIAAAANGLSEQSDNLHRVFQNLESIVWGEKNQTLQSSTQNSGSEIQIEPKPNPSSTF